MIPLTQKLTSINPLVMPLHLKQPRRAHTKDDYHGLFLLYSDCLWLVLGLGRVRAREVRLRMEYKASTDYHICTTITLVSAHVFLHPPLAVQRRLYS